MPTFYKTWDMPLATVIFNGTTFYEFMATQPDVFECEVTDPDGIAFLTKMGYLIKPEAGFPKAVEAEAVVVAGPIADVAGGLPVKPARPMIESGPLPGAKVRAPIKK
jgi:hypothetical protein